MPAGIFGIVLYDFAFIYNSPNICGGYEAIKPGHLGDCMWQVEYSPCSSSSDLEFQIIIGRHS